MPEEPLLLVDGHRANDAIFENSPISRELPLDVDLIERVEVIRGPSSSLYGANAVFGVINIITRRGRDVGTEISVEGGSFGTGKGRVSYGHTFQRWEVLLSGSFYGSAGETFYFPEFDTPQTNNGIARGLDDESANDFLVKVSHGHFTFEGVDVQMPEMDGFAATAAIRQREQVLGGHLPIVAMTAHALKGDRERCLAAGMDGYIPKPVSVEAIQAELQKVVAPPGSIAPDPPAWDYQQARARTAEDEVLLREIVKIFLQESPRLLEKIELGLAEGDGEGLERAAHSLKGQIRCLAAPEALSAAEKLEERARARDFPAAAAALPELDAAMARLDSQLQKFCEVPSEDPACRR